MKPLLRPRRGEFASVVGVVALLGALSILPVSVTAGAAVSVEVSGTVVGSGGTPIPGVLITAVDPGTSVVRFGPTVTAEDGRFSLQVEAGSYDFRFDPPDGSGLVPVVHSRVSVTAAQTINVQMIPAPPNVETHRFSGVVATHEGSQLHNLRASLGGVSGRVNVDGPGGFALDVPSGVYTDLKATNGLAAIFTPEVPNYPWAAVISPGPGAVAFDLTTHDVVQNLRMPPTTTIEVTVRDAAGNLVGGGYPVGAKGASTPGVGFAFVPGGPADYRLDSTASGTSTAADGVARFLAFTGISLPAGEVCVRAVPGFVSTFCNDTPIDIGGDPVRITLVQPSPPAHTFSGVVRDAGGAPVPGITVGVGDSSTRTRSDGWFSITKSPGKYPLRLAGGSPGMGPLGVPGLPSGFWFTGPPDTLDLTTKDVTAELRLPPTVTVTVTLKDAAGNPAPGVPVEFRGLLPDHDLLGSQGPTFESVQTGEVSDDRSSSDGVSRFTIFRGTVFAADTGICAEFAVTPRLVCNTAPLDTSAGDTSLTLSQKPPTPTYTLSGKLSTAATTPTPGVTINLGNAFTRTGTDGSFRITHDPGTLRLSVGGGGGASQLDIPGLPRQFSFSRNDFTLSTDVDVDLRLPTTTTATVVVKDSHGTPVTGANVSVRGRFAHGYPLIAGDPATFDGGILVFADRTDSRGESVVTVFSGLTFAPGTICIDYDSVHECNATTLTTADGELSLVFQQQLPVPAAPDGLRATTPTSIAPTLSWNPVVGADHYVIYRGDTVAGTANGTVFTDVTAVDGALTYAVAAANGAGIGPKSHAIIVVFDSVAPTVTGQPDRPANSGGWYNAPVTIDWSAVDIAPSSGTPTQPPPTVLDAEGIGMVATSDASCDPAGNCATGRHPLSIDRTSPELHDVTWSVNPVTVGASTTMSVTAADLLSGVRDGEYFLGSDPGVGMAAPLTRVGGQLTATIDPGLPVGVHDIGLRARDNADNWSAVVHTMLVVFDPTGVGVTGKNRKDLVPQQANGDVLPGLTDANQTDAAEYGFTVDYRDGALDPRNDFHFSYTTGTNCNSPQPLNCHSLTLRTDSFDWLVIDQPNNSRSRFQGLATITVDGVVSVTPVTVEAIDGARRTPSTADQILIRIYPPATNPSTAAWIYQASGSLDRQNSVHIR